MSPYCNKKSNFLSYNRPIDPKDCLNPSLPVSSTMPCNNDNGKNDDNNNDDDDNDNDNDNAVAAADDDDDKDAHNAYFFSFLPFQPILAFLSLYEPFYRVSPAKLNAEGLHYIIVHQ